MEWTNQILARTIFSALLLKVYFDELVATINKDQGFFELSQCHLTNRTRWYLKISELLTIFEAYRSRLLVDYIFVRRTLVLIDSAILTSDKETTAVRHDTFESLSEGRISNICIEFTTHCADNNVTL